MIFKKAVCSIRWNAFREFNLGHRISTTNSWLSNTLVDFHMQELHEKHGKPSSTPTKTWTPTFGLLSFDLGCKSLVRWGDHLFGSSEYVVCCHSSWNRPLTNNKIKHVTSSYVVPSPHIWNTWQLLRVYQQRRWVFLYHHAWALVVEILPHFSSTASLLFACLPFWLVTWLLGKEGKTSYRNRNEML